MDPEVLRELQDSINKLNDMVTNQATALSSLNRSVSDSSNTIQQNTTSQKTNTASNNAAGNGAANLSRSQKQASDIITESSKNLQAALGSGASAVTDFTKALLSNQEGFTKYGSTVGNLGKASLEIGKNFGIIGTVLGLLGFAFGKMVEVGLKQADAQLKAVDTLSGIGGAGKFTTKEMMGMAHKMGLNSFNLEKFTKAAESSRGSMISFNGNAGDGIKEFANLTAVTSKQRMAFQRLGVSQEELMQRQGDYLELQRKSGIAIDKRSMADGSLQKLSLEYAQGLAVISQVTGRNAKEAKEGQERAMAAVNMQIHTRQLNQDLKRAQAVGNADEVERIQKKLLIEKDLVNAAEQTGDAAQLAAIQSKLATGSYTKTSAVLLRTNIDVDKIEQEGMKRSLASLQKDQAGTGEAAAAYHGMLRDGVGKNVKNLGNSLATGDQLAADYGVTLGTMAFTAKTANTDYKDAYRKANDRIGKPSEGAPPPATAADPAQDARNKLTQVEITAGIMFDNLVASMNPLLGNTGPLKMLAIAAGSVAVLFGVAAAVSGGKKLVGAISSGAKGLGGMLGFGGGAAAGAAENVAGAALGPGSAGGKTASTLQTMSSSGGAAGGGFLEGVVRALILSGKDMAAVVQGATGLSIAIIEISAALGAGAVILGVTLPVLATGLSKFNKIDGENLKQVGFGMAGLGAGIALMGAGTVVGAIGNVINWFVGGEDPLDNTIKQISKLQAYDIDKKKVENNSEAMVAFSTAMAKSSLLGAASGLGSIGSAIAESTTKFFKATPPLTQFVMFSLLPINAKQTLNNATAFKYFAEAMASYTGMGSPIGAISTAIAQSAYKFFGVKPPLEQFVDFSKLNIDPKKTSVNAKAFVDFSNAMAEYKGGPGLLDTISSLAGKGFGALFGQDGPIEAFEKFAQKDFGPKMTENSEAFAKYAQTVATLSIASGGGGGGGGGGSFGGAVQSGVQAGAAAGGALVGAVGGAASAVGSAIGGAAESAWSTVTAGWDALKIKSILNFTGASGSFDNFQALNPEMKKAVLAAGSEYKQETGKKLQVNSAKRSLSDQQRLWDTSVKNGTPGRQPNGRLVAKPNANAPHMKGNAIDLQQGISDTTRTNRILAKYKLVNKYGKKDLPHYDLQAEYGGIFDGPSVSFPSDSDRGKKLSSLKADSLLMKLAKTPFEQMQGAADSTARGSADDQSTGNQGAMNLELYNLVSHKLDSVLSALESSKGTHHKMLKHSLA